MDGAIGRDWKVTYERGSEGMKKGEGGTEPGGSVMGGNCERDGVVREGTEDIEDQKRMWMKQ